MNEKYEVKRKQKFTEDGIKIEPFGFWKELQKGVFRRVEGEIMPGRDEKDSDDEERDAWYESIWDE